MAHVFRAQSYIRDANPATEADNDSIPDDVEKYIEGQDTGGGGSDIDEVICVSSCRLSGDRIFTLIVIEDQVSGG